MPDSYVFLFGANPMQPSAQLEFVRAAGGARARLVLLLVRRDGWEHYLPRYLDQWMRFGVRDYRVIVPDEDQRLDSGRVCDELERATCVFIGGGHTETYHRLYATGGVGATIVQRHHAGVPLAGSSAGALIMPRVCRLSSWDTDSGQAVTLPGLGALSDVLVSVHFESRQDEAHILRGMVETRIPTAWGINDDACAVFHNGVFSHALGDGVYRLAYSPDFEHYSKRKF